MSVMEELDEAHASAVALGASYLEHQLVYRLMSTRCTPRIREDCLRARCLWHPRRTMSPSVGLEKVRYLSTLAIEVSFDALQP